MTNGGQQPDDGQIDGRNPNGSIFTEEHIRDAERYPTLGASYFCSRDVIERAMAHVTDAEDFKPMVEKIVKTVSDQIMEHVWDAVRDYLLSDTEMNLHGAMREQIDGTVQALLSGQQWALDRYVLTRGFDGPSIRKALAAAVPEFVEAARIADLEAKVAEQAKTIERLQSRY